MKKYTSALALITNLSALLCLTGLTTSAAMSVKITDAKGEVTKSKYTPISKAKKPWRIMVIFPNIQDPFWLAANYGVVEEAKRLGVKLKVVSAQSYADLAGQNALLKAALKEKANAVIVSPINSKVQNKYIEALVKKKKVPVIGLINPVMTNLVTARRQMDYTDPGRMAAEFVLRKSKDKKIKVAILPGPAGAGWTEGMYQGFMQVLKMQSRVNIVATKWGDTNVTTQTKIINRIIKAHPDLDYLVGNAVASDVAVKLLAKAGMSKKTKIVSFYNNTGVIKGLRSGKIAMSPNDYTVDLARTAVAAAVEVLEGKKVPPVLGPVLTELKPNNIKRINYTSTFAPSKYKPVFLVNWR